jgi:hypothetical protein
LKQQQREHQRAMTLRATVGYGNDLADAADSIAGDLASSKINGQKALDQFDAAAGKLNEHYSKDLPPDFAEAAGVQIDNTARDMRRKLLGAVQVHQRDQTVAAFQDVREGLQRRAMQDLPGAISAYTASATKMLGDAQVKPEVIAKDIQDFKERTTFTFAANLLNRNNNSVPALTSLAGHLSDPKYLSDLDPERRRVLLDEAERRIDVLNTRAQRAEEVRTNKVGHAMDQVQSLALRGVYPTADTVEQLREATKGTTLEPEFKTLMSDLEDQRSFTQLSPDQMKAELDADATKIAREGGNADDARRLQRRAQTFAFTVKQLKEDPLGYWERTTGQDVAPLDLQNPHNFASSIASRVDLLRALNAKTGSSLGVLRPEEAAAVQQMIRPMPASAKASFLRTLSFTINASTTRRWHRSHPTPR